MRPLAHASVWRLAAHVTDHGRSQNPVGTRGAIGRRYLRLRELIDTLKGKRMNSELASVFNRECILAMPPSVTQRSLVWRSVSSLSEAGKVSNASVPRLVALCLEEPALLMRADGQASLLRVFTVEVNSCAGTIALVPQGAILPTAPSAARVVFVLFCPLERHAEASLIFLQLYRICGTRWRSKGPSERL